jgi:hypothetical protein
MPPAGLTNYTFAFGDTGSILNTDSIGLPFVDVTSITGLDTAPLRTTTDEHQGTDGTYVDSPYFSMRTVVVTGTLYTDPLDPDSLLDMLKRDYNSNLIRPWYFQLPGKPLRFVNGQGGGLVYNVDTNRRIGITPVQFSVLAGDPYIYDYPGQSIFIGTATVVNIGTGFNMAFNVGFGGSILTNSGTVVNNGTHTAYPTITMNGPLTNPTLVDSVGGITMSFNITLAAGDQLVVNCKDRSVVLNGTVSRRNTLAGLQWFKVPAGMSETIAFGATAGTGTATVNLYNTYY